MNIPKILSFDKPKKVRSTEKHNEMYSSDSGIPGTFVPNMSEADMDKWKAKYIKGKNERIEIRKTIEGTQLLIIVYKKANPVKWNYNNQEAWKNRHQNVKISMNGKLDMTLKNYGDFLAAILEAFDVLGVK